MPAQYSHGDRTAKDSNGMRKKQNIVVETTTSWAQLPGSQAHRLNCDAMSLFNSCQRTNPAVGFLGFL